MEQARLLLTALWEPFSFLSLFLYTGLALLLGAGTGLLLAFKLQRLGWLARNKRWHHWLLKLCFLLLPLAGGLLGFQADFLLGLLKRQIGHVFKPFYIALLIQLGLLLALVAAEWGVSRWLRQLPARLPVEPLAQL